MTVARLFSVFASLPLAVQVAIPLALLLLGLGVWTASTLAGRAVAWADGRRRRNSPNERRRRERARDRHMRAVARAPQSAFDQVLRDREIRFAGELDLEGDDLEEADHGRR